MARILIIDDDPAMVSVISDICQERGHQTIAYASGQKALENLAAHAPQLVISDLRMDKVGGLDILRECREVLPQTPVILITADKTVETALEAMKLGLTTTSPSRSRWTSFSSPSSALSITRA